MDPAIRGWRRYTFVEPPLVLYLFAQALTGAVLTDLMIFRTCQSILDDRKNNCDILHTNSSSQEALALEAESQPHATYVLMFKSLVDGLLPAFLSLFLGPWSDRYGRKPLMIVGYAGSALSFFLWTILCTLNIDPWFYIAPSVPTAFGAGFCGIILGSFCFITDIRSAGDRAWHMTWMQAVISAGLFFGTFAGSAIFKAFGYPAVFGIACACSTLSTLYVIFVVPETVIRRDEKITWYSLFDLSLVKKMIMTCTTKRDGFNRVVVWSCIGALSINVLVMEGDLGIGYQFASAKFGWNINDYSLYQAMGILLSISGTLLGAKFFRAYVDQNLADMRISIFANISYFAGAMTKALATKPWNLYLSSGISMFGGLSSPVLRAVLANSVPPQDAGKVFSLTTSMETILPLGAAPLYTLIYTHNMPPIYPAPVYLTSAAIYAVIIIIAIMIDTQLLNSRISRYTVINEEIN